MKRIIYLMVLAGVISACQSGKEANTTLVPIAVDSVSFNQESPFDTTHEKSYIKVYYPKLSGGNDSVITKVNAFMANLPLNRILDLMNNEKEGVIKNLDEAAKAFFLDIEKQKKKSPDVHIAGHFYEGSGDTVLLTPNLISLSFHEFMFSGGAHPDRLTSYYNFDANTGKMLGWTDMVKDTTAFMKIAELKFRESETKEAKENNREFSMDDYFFEAGKYTLPANISIAKDGLKLLYNPSEIAPHARQHILIDIPWKELKGIIAENYAVK